MIDRTTISAIAAEFGGFVTLIIDPTPAQDGTDPARLLDLVTAAQPPHGDVPDAVAVISPSTTASVIVTPSSTVRMQRQRRQVTAWGQTQDAPAAGGMGASIPASSAASGPA
jgi:hypothetical protein